jgi:hypothetical protein
MPTIIPVVSVPRYSLPLYNSITETAPIYNLRNILLCLYNILIYILIVGTVSPPDSGKSSETLTTGMIVGISVGGIDTSPSAGFEVITLVVYIPDKKSL